MGSVSLMKLETLLFGGKSKESNATADKISHAYRQWLDKLQMAVHSAYPGTQYVKVHSESLVGLFTCVFVKTDERDILRDVEVCTVKRGIGGIYGNKVSAPHEQTQGLIARELLLLV
jgi:hypothetical protein